MKKTILITGATDGIGLEAAKMLAALGHNILLHGRNSEKLAATEKLLSDSGNSSTIESFKSDLSDIAHVNELATNISEKHRKLDVLINNAGVYTPGRMTREGFDIRFAVNTIAPYLLTKHLLPNLDPSGRILNVSSAAQSPVDLHALQGKVSLTDGEAYAQSKLAITMWSRHLALALKDTGPTIIAVNPGSMLGSKMVKDAFGVDGGDIRIGGEILTRLATEDAFATASGQYYDNDARKFGAPHPDAFNVEKCEKLVQTIEQILAASND